ncbi:hypothetical protein SAM23877_1888 [Streptomyces ambofaciens ATCC 23877]|uniref:Uncharacterized protein n=1 Tax=Streptomyces ambofaciens (strain ATCC 23877 / 3486 / DSM 40053 / JCM 4204 / NBRC 12836 / NRRL B-2516) TaxID=278992 RepID=A0A0K2AQ04_STRA7|nr:hypothetical protein SAM23877_1888 [Streptomyces ambofaciens ATCC 23877]
MPFHVPQAGREDHRHRPDGHRDDVAALSPAHVLLEARPGPGDPEHLGAAAGTLLPHLVPPSARIGLSPPRFRPRPLGDSGPGRLSTLRRTCAVHETGAPPHCAPKDRAARAVRSPVRPYPACADRGTTEDWR